MNVVYSAATMDNELVKRLMWSGLLAGVGALSAITARKIAELIPNEPPTAEPRPKRVKRA